MDNISVKSRGSVGSLSEPVKIRCSYMRTARERMRFGIFGPPRRVYKVGNISLYLCVMCMVGTIIRSF